MQRVGAAKNNDVLLDSRERQNAGIESGTDRAGLVHP